MRHSIARVLLPLSLGSFAISIGLMLKQVEPFYTFFYLISWWCYILALDSWLFLKGGESLFLEKPGEFIGFWVPFSAFVWFVFEAFNLRLANWHYLGVPRQIWLRWPGNFLAFGSVIPGIYLTAGLLERLKVFPKNEFSIFFSENLPRTAFWASSAAGLLMMALPLIWPNLFFPLIWGGFVFLLDPWVAKWKGKSLIQEWRQKNFSRTIQLLLAGLICGGLWESWNFWAGAKWVYTLPSWVAGATHASPLRIFEMPLLGFMGFPPFALECFVMAEFALGVRGKLSSWAWKILAVLGFAFMAAMCRLMDGRTTDLSIL